MTNFRLFVSRARLLIPLLGVGLGFGLGACFDGLAAEGLPCETDAQCGPSLACIDNYCGGRFACADGSLVELSQRCDGASDCADGSDEDPEVCGDVEVQPNQCEAEPDQPLAWIEGPKVLGAADPIKVIAENFVDGGKDDFLIAGVGGSFVKVFTFGTGPDSQAEYFLNGDPPSFGTRTVADFEVADLEGDGDLDVVVVTDGDGIGVHTFQNDGVAVPAAYGPAADLPVDFTVRGLELGHIDDDDWIDLVTVVDAPNNAGRVFTGLGNPTAVPDGNYFSPELSTVQIPYTEFFASAVAAINPDELDDLIVTGVGVNGPAMWIVERDPNGSGVDVWLEPHEIPTPGPARGIAVGPLGGPTDDEPDVVVIDENDGRLIVFLNHEGMLMGQPAVDELGAGLSGVTIADVNCDELADVLVNVASPAEVRILLGDGLGGFSDAEIRIPSVGVPMGGLAVSQFDQDTTWDVIQAVNPGGQVADPEIRVWFTSDPMAGMMP